MKLLKGFSECRKSLQGGRSPCVLPKGCIVRRFNTVQHVSEPSGRDDDLHAV